MEKQEKTCGRKIRSRMFFCEYPVAFFCLSLLKKNSKRGFCFRKKPCLFLFFEANFYSVFHNSFKWKSRKTMTANFYRL
ncbi:hypothetical protein ESP47_08775 [Heyndrickxia coagulans]|nr:hypothetical protein CIW84_05045 [Heyndrickxia coagulans]QAU28731.1 hypothetical protein ESP47_08775 [Heyndrickxia coagulans]RCS33086.1 hypothetical protein DN050_07420 [Heyndrickxia coagulans]